MGLLHRETQRSIRIGEPLGVIMADLDHFKHINDSYGHPVGDVVLREVARRILASVRNYDYVGRYGGEEFLIVLAECSATDLAATAERMRVCVSRKRVETDSGPVPVTLSIGLVTGHAGGTAVLKGEELLRAADAALYCAKTKGRNRVEYARKKPWQARHALARRSHKSSEGVPSKQSLDGAPFESDISDRISPSTPPDPAPGLASPVLLPAGWRPV